MAERFENNPYAKGIEVGPRMSILERIRENLKNRVMEPLGGIFGNMLRDNVEATGRALKKIPDPLIQTATHIRNCYDRTMGAIFAPASQLFGSGVGEVLNFKPQDAGARTVVGVGTSFMFARDAISEATKAVVTPVVSTVQTLTGWVSDVYDNLVLGNTRFFTGLLFGKKAESPLYEVQPTAPRMQTPWTRASHRNPHISNAEQHKERDLRTIGHRDRYEMEVYNAAYLPPNGNPWMIPNKSTETAANNNNYFEMEKPAEAVA